MRGDVMKLYEKFEGLEDEQVLYRILESTLNLSHQESEVYFVLQNHPYKGVNELARLTGRNVSSLNRALKSLMGKGLVNRECRILRHGGYKYFYYPVPLQEVIPSIKEMIRSWITSLDSMVNSFSLKLQEKTLVKGIEVKYDAELDATLELKQ